MDDQGFVVQYPPSTADIVLSKASGPDRLFFSRQRLTCLGTTLPSPCFRQKDELELLGKFQILKVLPVALYLMTSFCEFLSINIGHPSKMVVITEGIFSSPTEFVSTNSFLVYFVEGSDIFISVNVFWGGGSHPRPHFCIIYISP